MKFKLIWGIFYTKTDTRHLHQKTAIHENPYQSQNNPHYHWTHLLYTHAIPHTYW